MKRYKLIGTQSNWPSFTPGKIYDANHVVDSQYPNLTIEYYADCNLNQWELVEECIEDNLSIVSVRNNNNVAINVTTLDELKECDRLLGWNHEYLYNNLDISKYGNNTVLLDECNYANILYAEKINAKIIKASDFIHYNKKQCVLVEEFTLPEKWCVKDNPDNVDVITNWFTKKLKREISGGSNYWHFPEEIICRNSICTSKNILPTYTEITFEQFEKYVLNVETNTTMEKQKLIGYKLKPEFESVKEFVHKLESCLRWQSENVIDLYQNLTIQKLKELKVLDIWFEPVYKQNFKLPTIGGYKAVDLGDEVKYGCQTYKVEDIKALYKSLSILNIESVKLDVYNINVSIDQILEIVKYFENK